jgi:hypothetical protein
MQQVFLLQVSLSQTFPVCPILMSVVGVSLLGVIGVACRDGFLRLRRLHQIPCDRCSFFTGEYRLKCTVHPCEAFTEAAIACRDFEPTSHPIPFCSKRCKGTATK